MTWEDINKKYPEWRDEMSKKREQEFVNDCFDIYEEEGFSKKFWSPYDSNHKFVGKRFTVLGRCDTSDCNLEILPAWRIRLKGGEIIYACPEEIIPSEMKENGCPFKEY